MFKFLNESKKVEETDFDKVSIDQEVADTLLLALAG
jgi:hypothetical protein